MADWKIPFKHSGAMMRYAMNQYQLDEANGVAIDDSWRAGHPDYAECWRDNFKFTKTLRFSHFQRGRSAAYAIFKTENDDVYYMFLTDLEKAIPVFENGVLQDKTFTFTKRGQNYGIKLV